MAGFREFAPGQVWFYYNPNATKGLEQKKELGMCTSRPVVIVQTAFYPEWNYMVTVCPMTSSDRRSGVYIDTTILKDGSIIEGGTVIPYLFYNIRTKYLYPVMASNHKRKLITLSDEDFAKVRHGFEYHFGMRHDPPEYVQNWHHLSDYDRDVMLQDVKLAIYNFEDTLLESHKHLGEPDPKTKITNKQLNPILQQEPAAVDTVENHILAELNHYDRDNGILFNETESFNSRKLEDTQELPEESDQRKVKHVRDIVFTAMDPSEFSEHLSTLIGGAYPVANGSIRPGSQVLNGQSLKDMQGMITQNDQVKLLNMTINDIMKQTGISSSSTASRFRKELRALDWEEKGIGYYDEEKNMMAFYQNDSPEPFVYRGDLEIVRQRIKKNARRRKFLFSYSKEELGELLAMEPDEIMTKTGMPRSYITWFRNDILILHPDLANPNTPEISATEPAIAPGKISQNELEAALPSDLFENADKYSLWQTLSPSEVTEIKNTSKKHVNNLSRNYGITKDRARSLRNSVVSMMNGNWYKNQPIVNPAEQEQSCMKLILGHYGEIAKEDLLAFCRSDPEDIARYFNQTKCANTPSKADIRLLKLRIRKVIAKT